jgi:hypothetical protein
MLVFKVNSKYRNKDVSETIEMTVTDYLRAHKYVKSALRGFKVNGSESEINVDLVGRNTFYGWETDGNRRFLLHDRTVVHNCNQMFCTKCNTPFDWRTGRPIHGPIHNPHYFEYMRARRGNEGNVEIAPEIECNQELTNRFVANLSDLVRCYSLSSADNVDKLVSRKMTQIISICRNTIHLRYMILPMFEVNFVAANEQLRVKYMMNQISEEKFKSAIQYNDKKHQRNGELSNVFDMLCRVVTDILYRIRASLIDNSFKPDEYFNELNRIIAYTNEHLAEIGETYGSTIIHHVSEDISYSTIPRISRA